MPEVCCNLTSTTSGYPTVLLHCMSPFMADFVAKVG
jgi:hypothetical protein